jgi:hypothetical protein
MIGRFRGEGKSSVPDCGRRGFTVFVIIYFLIPPARNLYVDGSRRDDVWLEKSEHITYDRRGLGSAFSFFGGEVGMRDQVGLVGMRMRCKRDYDFGQAVVKLKYC